MLFSCVIAAAGAASAAAAAEYDDVQNTALTTYSCATYLLLPGQGPKLPESAAAAAHSPIDCCQWATDKTAVAQQPWKCHRSWLPTFRKVQSFLFSWTVPDDPDNTELH